MSTQTHTDAQTDTNTESTLNIGELSFTDYERMRRGEPVEGSKQSAPAEEAEQKPASESDPEEADAKEEEMDESEEDADEADSKDTEKDKPRKKGGFRRRIEKLIRDRDAERTRAMELEERLARFEKTAGGKESEKPGANAAQAADGKPNPEHFETHSEYVEALTEWKLDQREKVAKAESERARLMNEQAKVQQAHFERIKSFREKTSDYEEVIMEAPEVEFPPTVIEAIMTSDLGPQIIYELAKNPAEAERIASLSSAAAAHAIGKLEAKLESRAEEAKKPEPKKLTSAPKPIAPVGGGKGGVAKSITDPELSFAEYERMRREQNKRRQG